MTDEHKRICNDCTWHANYGFITQCDNEYVSDLMYFDIYPDASKCDQYRKRDEFEDWLISIIRNYEKKEIDEFKIGDQLDISRYKEIRDVVEGILWKYQEMREEEEQE